MKILSQQSITGFVFWLAWFGLALLISLNSLTPYTYDLLRFVFAGVLALLSSLSFYLSARIHARETGLVWGVLWAVLLTLLSVPYAYQTTTWLELYQLAVFVPTFMMLGLLLVQRGWLKTALLTLVHALPIVAFIYSVVCLYNYLFALLDNEPQLVTFLPWGFLNIRYWSQVASWVLPLLPLSLLLSPLKDNSRWKFLVYFSLAIWVWVLMLSTARGSIFSLLVSFTLCAFIFKGLVKEWLIILLKGILLGVGVWVLLSLIVHPYFVDASQLRPLSTTSSNRTILWKEALIMSWQNFPFGMGPFSWFTHDFFTEKIKRLPLYGHPHNHILLWAAEYGWLVIAPLIGVVWHAIGRLRKLVQNKNYRIEHVALTASVLAAFSHSLLSAVFITPYSLMFGLAVLSIFWGLLHEDAMVATHSKATSALFKITAVSLLVLGAWWLNYIYDYYRESRVVIEEKTHTVKGMNSPRFFQHTVILKD